MPIHFRCPHCDKLLALGLDKGGTHIQCPLCAQAVTVPKQTEVQLPTTTVLSGEAAQGWWMDAPALAAPPAVSPPPPAQPLPQPPAAPPAAGDAWWLATGSAPAVPPPVSVTTEPSPPPLTSEAILPSLPAPEPAESAPRKRVRRRVAPPPRFPLSHILLLLALAAVLIAVNVFLVPWRSLWQTAIAPDEEQPGKPASTAPADKPSDPEKTDDKHPGSTEAGKTEEDPPPESTPVAELLAVKHRREQTEEELRNEVAAFVELSLERGKDRAESQHARRLALESADQGEPVDVVPRLVQDRADLAGLPLRPRDAAHLKMETAQQLQSGSLALRARLFEATRGGQRGPSGEARPDAKKLQAALAAKGQAGKWQKPEAIPALQQLLMGEEAGVRTVLVDQLTRIAGKRASIALAQRALFDLDAVVRQRALTALAKRPYEEYRAVLMDGFHYPWPAVVDHAAEALAALGRREEAPILRSLLDQPDPALPYKMTGKLDSYVREVVRINHLRNCVLCHAPSVSEDDKLRGFVPPIDQPVPPPYSREYYANRRGGFFIRADRTYLQQDFAVRLAVANAGVWPTVQRYDCLVRERPATAEEVQATRPIAKEESPYQQAIRFALRELEAGKP